MDLAPRWPATPGGRGPWPQGLCSCELLSLRDTPTLNWVTASRKPLFQAPRSPTVPQETLITVGHLAPQFLPRVGLFKLNRSMF